MPTKKPQGTEDLIASGERTYQQLMNLAYEVFGTYGYEPIETPLFERIDLFVRGIGESTDVVGKEMFHVLASEPYRRLSAEGTQPDAKHHLALRPEGTASVVRAVIEHNLLPQGGTPVKLMYAGPMFRAERPQRGRLREFHQFGVECLGATAPSADAEVIIMLMRFFGRAGIPRDSIRLLINSMGDDACRPAYRESVSAYMRAHADELCDDCKRRIETNPLRAFDCKNPDCRAVMHSAPLISDALCDGCSEHYAAVKGYLDRAGITYEEDPRLVRGLDYYTNTVFEVQVIDGLGAQNAIGGGGRYDKLMESLGGKSTPGLGFAIGYERLVLALEAAGVPLGEGGGIQAYVAKVDSSCDAAAFQVMQALRDAGIRADCDHQGRSLKSQFKVAGKSGAAAVVVCGPDELAAGEVTVRAMDTHEEQRVAFGQVPQAVSALIGK